jgi:hypothetical protein
MYASGLLFFMGLQLLTRLLGTGLAFSLLFILGIA